MIRMKDMVKETTPPNSPDSSLVLPEDISPPILEKKIIEPPPATKKPRFNNDDIYEKGCLFLKKVAADIRGGHKTDISFCLKLSEAMVISLMTHLQQSVKSYEIPNQKSLIYLAIGGGHKDYDYFTIHAINVAIYSIKIGIDLQYDKSSLIELCSAAILHDIGMLKIPEDILKKETALSDEEKELIKNHPQFGREILESLGSEYKHISEIIFQEHEREDGSGYPNGLTGDEIQECAKIIGITDVFEAMTHIRPYKKALMPFQAIKEIIRSKNRDFPSKIIKALLRGLSIFPVGSLVKLNSKEIGKVTSIDERHPLRPILDIEFDSEGRKPPHKKVVDLRKDLILFISSVLSTEGN